MKARPLRHGRKLLYVIVRLVPLPCAEVPKILKRLETLSLIEYFGPSLDSETGPWSWNLQFESLVITTCINTFCLLIVNRMNMMFEGIMI